MTHARLIIELPDGPWIAEVSRRHPEATFRILAAIPTEESGFGLVRITAPDLPAVLASMTDQPTLEYVEVLQRTDTEATVQIETSTPMILLAAKRSGIPVEMPVEVRDGEATVDVAGGHDRLSEFGTQLDTFGISFEVRYIQERLHPSQLLTERQQEVLLAGVENGYYDTPRTCTLTELADEIGLAKSTCSEILHRAEEIIIKDFIEDLPAADAVPADLLDRPESSSTS